MSANNLVFLAADVARRFCEEFLCHPYLCYTEHGLHALFFSRLLEALPSTQRYSTWQGKKFCIVQKEYPTATPLGKSKRQHWDISVIRIPPKISQKNSFDYLGLSAVFEFGMNASKEHLKEDIRRLTHQGANLDHGFALHFHRICEPGKSLSRRDCSSDSNKVCTLSDAQDIQNGTEATVFYVMSDPTGTYQCGFWEINAQSTKKHV